MRIPHAQDRAVGVVVPVGALRGSRSTAVGEFPDLIELGELCRTVGISIIQLLPVNDTGFQSSPYSALTAFGLNPLYLRISDLSEAARHGDRIDAALKPFMGETRFPYEKILRIKLDLLRAVYDEHRTEIAARAEKGGPLALWMQDNPWVREYAVFRRLKDQENGAQWMDWKLHSTIFRQDIDALWSEKKHRGEHLFWVWLQAALDDQFRSVSRTLAEMGIALKGDLPILMNEDSCDVWAHPNYFRRDLSAGAPPDMFSPLGQNWQFPIYDWDALAKDDYAWWRQRLAVGDRYYGAYRIDHVLGFFRIWAAPKRDYSAVLGRFIPSHSISRKELEALGFDIGRIRWLSQPHLPTQEIHAALGGGDAVPKAEISRIFDLALQRIGDEELWLFKDSVKGERDIQELGLHQRACEYLQRAWRDRVFAEFEPGLFSPAWSYWDTRAFPSLSEDERRRLEELIQTKRRDSEKDWENQGRHLLATLASSTGMLACAEDLGAVPDCVPKVLEELGILGLRVVRWARHWGEPGEPYIPLQGYPELSVCTPAVHDSSTVREWWEREADQDLFKTFLGESSLSAKYDPQAAKVVLGRIALARSRLCVFQIQDLLHLSSRWYAGDPASERVNVPGTINEFNWTYRLPATLKEIAADGAFIAGAKELCSHRLQKRNRE